MTALHQKVLSRIRRHRHNSQFRRAVVLNNPEAGRLIRSRIQAGDPLMVSRFSTCEINVLNICRQRFRGGLSRSWNGLLTGIPKSYTDKVRFQAHNNAGIFPATDAGLDAFSLVTFEACSLIDILGVWSHPLHLEEQLQQERCPSAQCIALSAIEPYHDSAPWSAALAGKQVLVIHPFEASIQRQYQKRELLFDSPEVLPAFELKTIRAVQTNAGGEAAFPSWTAALESMTAQIDALSFDVALIGAGAYGLPLAAHVKSTGRQAVHLGGALQLLFGIKGARWDSRPDVSRLYNEHWVRPLPEETPVQSGQVEEGCYW
jgi:hypothetical protein